MIPPGWERVAAYCAVLLLVVVPASVIRGGRPEQAAAAILAIGSIASFVTLQLMPIARGGGSLGVFAIDLLVAAGFTVIALLANRHWPIWLAALQYCSIIAHAVRWDNPGILRWVYKLFLFAPAWAMLGLILAGVIRHRLRLQRFGVDGSWRTSSARRRPNVPTPTPPR